MTGLENRPRRASREPQSASLRVKRDDAFIGKSASNLSDLISLPQSHLHSRLGAALCDWVAALSQWRWLAQFGRGISHRSDSMLTLGRPQYRRGWRNSEQSNDPDPLRD
jgi:hypothetical protein